MHCNEAFKLGFSFKWGNIFMLIVLTVLCLWAAHA